MRKANCLGQNHFVVTIFISLGVFVAGMLICPKVSSALDLLPYIIPENENFRVFSRLKYPDGGTAEETFSYRDGGWADGIRRWFFTKNDSGENWEEFGYDSTYIYRNRDTSWANTCQDGADAYYKVTDQDRTAFARWIPRYMNVGQIWSSPWSHYVDAGYRHNNGCDTDACTSPYEGWVQNRHQLVAHHSTYTTIWGYTVNDVIELADPNNADSDHFFYARGYGLVGFEGPAGNNQGRFKSGAYYINSNAGGPPNWIGLCGEQLPAPPIPPPGPGIPPGENLAHAAPDWSASSAFNADFAGEKATDGVITVQSKWASDGTSVTSWLALDLGTDCDLTGFIVRHAGAAGEPTTYNTQNFRLELGSSLTGPWAPLVTVDNSAQQNSSITILESSVTARYVRLYILDAGIDNFARIPEFEVYGSTASTPPPAGGPLVNGSFEGSVQGSGIGDGWYGFSSDQYGVSYAVVSEPVYQGSSAQQVVSPQPTTTDQYAGVYQIVATEPGSDYTVRVWNRTHFTGGSAWDHIARLGIDLTGGTDFQANSVEWYEFDSAKDAWHQLELSVTASASAMTIFLQSWRKWTSGGGSLTWFDDVAVFLDSQPPAPDNNPPVAATTASPTSGEAPLTVSFNATGSSDPDGDPLSFSWDFGDGAEGSGANVSHTYHTQGIYPVALTVTDGRGGSDEVTATISVSASDVPLPSFCPSALDFAAIQTQLNQQGQDLAFAKIGFHVGLGGNQTGLGEWMACLDAAGVPFFLKSVDSAGQIWEAAGLKAASGVPHVLVYRKSVASGWNADVPEYHLAAYDAAALHWQRHRDAFPPELEQYKHLIWVETINEVDKNRAEWLGEFAYHTARMAMADGFNWAAFGWSSGEPERAHWEGPWMRKFLELAGNNPDRVAVALHEYSYVRDNLDRLFPYLVGRFQMLFDVCDSYAIPRPTVLITEFGWEYQNTAGVDQAMSVDLPWAAKLYADFPRVRGAAIWYLGGGWAGISDRAQKLIAPMTAYALQNYFVVPLESAPLPEHIPTSITGGEPKGLFGSGGQTDAVTDPETWRWSEWFYGHQGIDQIAWLTEADTCGTQQMHNYAIGWHQNDLVEYLMKFGGIYRRLTLRGMADRPGPLRLEIYIDGDYRTTVVWDNDNGCNQDVSVEINGIPYNTHAIAVKFVNDYYDPATGEDRNLFLDGLRVTP